MPLTAGTRLGPYEILQPIGVGGMGEVYRARHVKLRRDVAIKILPADLATDRSRLAPFEREARTASALNHPNIVVIHGRGSPPPSISAAGSFRCGSDRRWTSPTSRRAPECRRS